jgi:8-oxo-dGTP pyrophosphatase MutT (NUDIX family)
MILSFAKHPPGKQAQLEMAPANRFDSLQEEASLPPPGAVDAAVLVLLTPAGKSRGRMREDLLEWKVLLIRRNSYPGVHSGQIAFPGGRREASDHDLRDTACREAYEETGIGREQMAIVGALTSLYVPASNFVMHPFLALNKAARSVRLNPGEAVAYRNIPVRVFNPGRAAQLEFDFADGRRRPAPAWRYRGFTIWGATAMILAELYRLVESGGLVRDS